MPWSRSISARLPVLLGSILLWSCGSASNSPTTPTITSTSPPTTSDVVTIRDVPYGSAAGITLLLDVVKPAAPSSPRLPLVIYIHGGGFVSGDKSGGLTELEALARRGYVGATINYRLGSSSVFPAQVQDVKTAIRFLRANSAQYGVDETRIALWGVSSGGTLAALAGTGNDVAEWEGSAGTPGVSSRVKSVTTWFGTYDLLDSCAAARPDVTVLLGCAPATCVGAAKAASALTYVSQDDPAFFVMPGACPAQGQQFHLALTAAGVSSVLNLDGAEGGVPASASAASQAFLDLTLGVTRSSTSTFK